VKTIYSQQKPFVYLWRDRLFNRYYVGYHGGFDPNYVCSSKEMKSEYKSRPNDFKRRILAFGTKEEMIALEQDLLRARKHHFDKRYYNLMINHPVNLTEAGRKKISMTHKGKKNSKEVRLKMSRSTTGKKHSEESKQKMRIYRLENPSRIAESGRQKISMTHKGKKFTAEHRRKICLGQKLAWIKRKQRIMTGTSSS